MTTPTPDTYFDRPGRSTESELAALTAQVEAVAVVADMIDGLPGPTCLLDGHRQIVFVNQAVADLLHSLGRDGDPLGQRLIGMVQPTDPGSRASYCSFR